MVEPQEPPRQDWDWVFLVIHVRHEPTEQSIDEISEFLVPDAGHPIAHHAHGDARIEIHVEEDAVEEGERRAERVAHDRDGGRALLREGTLNSREDGRRRAACV